MSLMSPRGLCPGKSMPTTVYFERPSLRTSPTFTAKTLTDPVAVEQPPEIRTIEAGDPRGLRDRSAGALKHAGQVAALELGGRHALGLGERGVRDAGGIEASADGLPCEGLGDLAIELGSGLL